jgi:hypothetical protein
LKAASGLSKLGVIASEKATEMIANAAIARINDPRRWGSRESGNCRYRCCFVHWRVIQFGGFRERPWFAGSLPPNFDGDPCRIDWRKPL